MRSTLGCLPVTNNNMFILESYQLTDNNRYGIEQDMDWNEINTCLRAIRTHFKIR